MLLATLSLRILLTTLLIQLDFHRLQSPSEHAFSLSVQLRSHHFGIYVRRKSRLKSILETLNDQRMAFYLQKQSCQRAGASPAQHTERHTCWWKCQAAQLWKAALRLHLDVDSMHTGLFHPAKKKQNHKWLGEERSSSSGCILWGNYATRNSVMEGGTSFLHRRRRNVYWVISHNQKYLLDTGKKCQTSK